MLVGGVLGILFVTLLRRVMVEDPDLPFPESVAAAEIHKAGQQGARAAKILFANMGIGATFFLGAFKVLRRQPGLLGSRRARWARAWSRSDRSGSPDRAPAASPRWRRPAISPAYLGVGYIIGPRLGALNFAGGVFAWGLLVPLLAFFLGPQLRTFCRPGRTRTGPGWPAPSGATSCAPSRWAA